jgi:hypothetical protein
MDDNFPHAVTTDPQPRKAMNAEALKMGLMMGALLVAYSLVLHFAGLMTNKSLGWISYALVLAGVYLGVKNYRDHHQGGFITFGQAFGMGFRIVLYASLLLAVFTYIYYKTFGHDTIGVLKDMMMTELSKSEVSEAQAEQVSGIYERWVFIPGTLAIGTFVGTLVMGVLLSLVNAAILKRENDVLERPMP